MWGKELVLQGISGFVNDPRNQESSSLTVADRRHCFIEADASAIDDPNRSW
jgi:hypothetical protein